MDNQELLSVMIQTIKYSRTYSEYQSLCRLLSCAELNCLPQWGFVPHGQSGQRYEDIELRVPVPLLDEAINNNDAIEKLTRKIYQETREYAMGDFRILPLLREPDYSFVSNKVAFTGIRDTLVQGIRAARYSIWVAVAWFTNHALFDELLSARERGLSVRVVVSDEEANRHCGLLDKIMKSFDAAIVSHWGYSEWSRMHHKFCIVDSEYVMHGSYNWTDAAENNNETLETTNDREMANKFADEFIRLYCEGRNKRE